MYICSLHYCICMFTGKMYPCYIYANKLVTLHRLCSRGGQGGAPAPPPTLFGPGGGKGGASF